MRSFVQFLPQWMVSMNLGDMISTTLNTITAFDYIILLLLLLFLVRGLWLGFVRQLATTVALVGSYWLAGRYVGQIIPFVEQVLDQPAVVFLASFAGLFLVFLLLFSLISHFLHDVLEVNLLGWTNRLLGGLLGLAKGALVASLLHMVLSSALSPSHHLFLNSQTAPHLSKGAEAIRQFIQNAKAREGLRPKIQEERPKSKEHQPPPTLEKTDGSPVSRSKGS